MLKKTTDKTLSTDYKVFLKTYSIPKKNTKTVEDDFNAPLLSLNLVSYTGRRNNFNEDVFRINNSPYAKNSQDFWFLTFRMLISLVWLNYGKLCRFIYGLFD